MAIQLQDRQVEIQQIWKDNRWLYIVTGFLGGVLFFPFLSVINVNMMNFLDDLIPEFVGIAFTVFLIDRINAIRDQNTYKDRLIRLISSRMNSVSIHSLEELRAFGWIKDGSLLGTNLKGANLADASLVNADIRGVSFIQTNLCGARFKNTLQDDNTILPDGTIAISEKDWDRFTDPQHPNFWLGYEVTNEDYSEKDLNGVNLRGADLWGTDFSKANLRGADLRGAELTYTNLCGTNLASAKLQNAVLAKTHFDVNTVLPDGVNWHEGIDLATRFDCILAE